MASCFVTPFARASNASTMNAKDSLCGKRALVTGASRGIGRGIAHALGERGATVYAVARSVDALEETAKRVRDAGGNCHVLSTDLGNDEAMEAMWNSFTEPLDIVVNCAYSGVDTLIDRAGQESWKKTGPGGDEKPGSFWDVVNNVGLRGVYVSSVYALRHFSTRGEGVLVNISSFGGIVSLFDAAYGTGKAGVDRLTSDLAKEAPKGVSVFTYYPGVVATETFSEKVLNVSNSKITTKNVSENVGEGEMPKWNVESPFFVGRALSGALADSAMPKEMHGKIVIAAEVGKRVGAVDEKGYLPLSMRSLRFAVASQKPSLVGTFWIKLVPDVYVPLWMMSLLVGPIKLW